MGDKGTQRAAEPIPGRRFLTYRQLADLLGFKSRQGVWKAVRRGDLPRPIKSGGITRFDEAAVLAMLRSKDAA